MIEPRSAAADGASDAVADRPAAAAAARARHSRHLSPSTQTAAVTTSTHHIIHRTSAAQPYTINLPT